MAFVVDEKNGNVTCYQGDSGEITFEGIQTDKNYIFYFAIQDENRKPVGEEISVNTNRASAVTIVIPASLSDLWVVPKGENTATYYYAGKLCDPVTGKEDTVMIDGSDFGDYNTITVYPKKVEGLA